MSRLSNILVGFFRVFLVLSVLLVPNVLLPPPALAQDAQSGGRNVAPMEPLRALQKQARKEGAKSHLPMAWRSLDSHLNWLEENEATQEQWDKVLEEARLLVNQAEFVKEIRGRKNSHEEMLSRFDQALREIATLYQVEMDPVLSGTPKAEALLEQLSNHRLQRQMALDSLTVDNRRMREMIQDRVVGQDSVITALNVEVSSLRQKLWEMQLRAGVAEADRSAAESVLGAKQKRDEAMAALFNTMTEKEGEILIRGNSQVTMRLSGVTFNSGSAKVGAKQAELLVKVAEAVGRFPGAAIAVEGHTDNKGGRDGNLRLSRRRAEAVAHSLEQMLGWDQGTIGTEGLGPDRPIAVNDTSAGRARNRRIELRMTLPE